MANMLKMMQQFREVRKLQKELESKTYEVKSHDGLIVVVARGDMTIKTLQIDPKAMDPAKPENLAKVIVSTVNSALDTTKKAAASDMQKMAGGLGGLSQMLGG
jgi:nucleoid-associated protein EbfC